MASSTRKTTTKPARAKSPAGTTRTRSRTAKPTLDAPDTTAVALAEPPALDASTTHVPTADEIAVRAHELYVNSGFVPGRDLEFWLEAERQLRSGR